MNEVEALQSIANSEHDWIYTPSDGCAFREWKPEREYTYGYGWGNKTYTHDEIMALVEKEPVIDAKALIEKGLVRVGEKDCHFNPGGSGYRLEITSRGRFKLKELTP